MNKTIQYSLASTLLALSNLAYSAELSYSYVSASFQLFTQEIPGIPEDLDGEGIDLSLSFGITDNIAILVSYSTGSADISSGGNTFDADINGFGIGPIYHTSVAPGTNFFVGFGIISGTIDSTFNGVPQPSEDADGNVITLGVRSMVSNKLELEASIDRSDIEDDTNSDVGFAGRYYIDTGFSIDAGYSFDSDGSTLTFGVSSFF